MAYFCLTVLEQRMIKESAAVGTIIGASQGHHSAATAFGIDLDVLDTYGALASEVGNDAERRTAHAENPVDRRDFNNEERIWLEAVVKEMIHRVVTRI